MREGNSTLRSKAKRIEWAQARRVRQVLDRSVGIAEKCLGPTARM